MEIIKYTNGELATNTYIIQYQNECLIIDPASEDVFTFLKLHNLCPTLMLLTHGHFDHIGAVSAIKQAYACPVYALEEERALCMNPDLNLSIMIHQAFTIQLDKGLSDLETIKWHDFEIQCLKTAGHTAGSCVYIIDQHLFSGDTLFKDGYGRFDFPSGSFNDLHASIERILALDEHFIVYPGHGDNSSITYERKFNPLSKAKL